MSGAPKKTCYICLEEDDAVIAGGSSQLMRGCACRGDSAGFVHLKCLTELAMSKEASGDLQTIFNGYIKCGNCKKSFEGVLGLEMKRRFWRHYRSSQDLDLRYHSTRSLAASLGNNGEFDAANQLLDDASTCFGNNDLELKLDSSSMLIKHGQELEALELLQAILPEAKACTTIPYVYGQALQLMTNVLLRLDRNQEAHEMAIELIAFAKAKNSQESALTLKAKEAYAVACAKLGHVEEAKANFEDVLTTEIRVFGPGHPFTLKTRELMHYFGFLPESAAGLSYTAASMSWRARNNFSCSSSELVDKSYMN